VGRIPLLKSEEPEYSGVDTIDVFNANRGLVSPRR
jgi:hypothetical protein